MIYMKINNFVVISYLEIYHSMVKTPHLKDVVILI